MSNMERPLIVFPLSPTCHSDDSRKSDVFFFRNVCERACPVLCGALVSVLLAACSPTVQLQAPDKPIEINLNVNVEQHIKVEIEKDVQKTMAQRRDIF